MISHLKRSKIRGEGPFQPAEKEKKNFPRPDFKAYPIYPKEKGN